MCQVESHRVSPAEVMAKLESSLVVVDQMMADLRSNIEVLPQRRTDEVKQEETPRFQLASSPVELRGGSAQVPRPKRDYYASEMPVLELEFQYTRIGEQHRGMIDL